MFNAGKSKNNEHSVHSTGVPLSERFKCVPSHNPLRPNVGTQRVVDVGECSTDDAEIQGPRSFHGGKSFLTGLKGVNKVAIIKAKKDAEIMRLREQVEQLQSKLNRRGNGAASDVIQTKRHGNALSRRLGGGFLVGQRGKQLNLQSTKALDILGVKRISMHPNRSFKKPKSSSSKGLNFFGSPRSKDDLDTELDAYMSKAKSKQKTDLDKEIDEYMKVARSQSFAGRAGLLASTPVTEEVMIEAESEDTAMDVVESL